MRTSLVATAALGFLAGNASAQGSKAPARTADARKWEHETSDLKPDPRFNFGALKNGFRYVWFKNDEPKKNVYLRLHVNIGSFVENDTELGIAHFIEHMAFNGTKNFKAGTLVETFNKEGIKFGHDVNAHTGFDETVYELDLPDASPERFTTALKWMRDVADGLKFEQAEVNSEKGVVDAEERDRGGEGYKNLVEYLSKMLDGTLRPKRLPIGVKSVRDKFNPKICFGFYRKWYRPEHMTFVLGGDLGDLDPTAEIEKAFGGIAIPKEPVPARPDPGKPTFANKAVTSAESGGGDEVLVDVMRLKPTPSRADDMATRTESVTRTFVISMLQRRLNDGKDPEEALRKGKLDAATLKKLMSGGYGADWFELENLVEGPQVQVHSDKTHWRAALMNAEREVRRAIERGFDEKELNAAYVKFDQTLVPRPRLAKQHSMELITELLKACDERYVPMDEKAGMESYKPGERARSVAACQKWLKDQWSSGELVFVARGAHGLGVDPLPDLTAIWDQAKATSLDKPLADQVPGLVADAKGADAAKDPKGGKEGTPADPAKPEPDGTDAAKGDEGEAKEAEETKGNAKDFVYGVKEAKKAPDGTDVKRDDKLKATLITFKNGVRAAHKHLGSQGFFSRSGYEVRFGEGELPLDPEKAEVAWVASQVFLRCGLAKNDWKTVRAALQQGAADVRFDVDGDSCVFRGGLPGSDVNLQRTFEVICAYLTDPGFRPADFDAWKKKLAERWSKEKEEEGKDADKPSLRRFLTEFDRELKSTDRRFQPPDHAKVEAVTLDEVKAFLKAQLDGPVTITLVGGLESYKIENALYSTFANLPPRRAARDFAAHRAIAPWKTGFVKKTFCDTGAASAMIRMVFPTTDGIDVATRRRLQLLEDVVDDRLRLEIREKKALAYSPRADSTWSEHWKGYGAVTLDVEVDEKKVDEATKAITDMMVNLGAKGVTQPEIDRLRTAALGDSAKWVEDDGFWWNVLNDAVQRPAALEEVNNIGHWYDAVTVADMSALCKQYFTKDKAAVFVAMPKK
jgi:zinc protease